MVSIGACLGALLLAREFWQCPRGFHLPRYNPISSTSYGWPPYMPSAHRRLASRNPCEWSSMQSEHQQRCQRPNTGKRRQMLTSKRAGCEFGLHNLLDSLLLRFSYGILVLIQIIIADPSESIFEFCVRA